MNNNTIFALSSGHSKSGVAVIRISGNNLTEFIQKQIGHTPIPRHAYFTNLRDDNNEIIDQCVVIYFAAPHSFTGQDVLEIQSHGAPAVINKIFEFLSVQGMRMATPGEFSKRAFYNGKMDLADVDGLVALLNAQTDMQRKIALQSMLGGDSAIYQDWRQQMIDISAYTVAMTDYAPDDLPANIYEQIITRIKTLYTAISAALMKYKSAHAIRDGIKISLVGETNVGKSSLFNTILGASRAIVSDIPGTTRDTVSANMDIDGYLVTLTDTAGLRETTDTIEKIGIDRTHTEIENADIVLHIITPNDSDEKISDNEILVVNKSDLYDLQNRKNAIYVSAKTGDGIEILMKTIRNRIHNLTNINESDIIINARTHALLNDAATELQNAIEKSNGDYDIMAEHIRYAADAIGKILGTISTNDVLDAVFSGLCLGK